MNMKGLPLLLLGGGAAFFLLRRRTAAAAPGGTGPATVSAQISQVTVGTHGVSKVPGNTIGVVVDYSHDTRSASGAVITWPYTITVQMGVVGNDGVFRNLNQLALGEGVKVLNALPSTAGLKSVFTSFITPSASGVTLGARVVLEGAQSDLQGQPLTTYQVLAIVDHPGAVVIAGATSLQANVGGSIVSVTVGQGRRKGLMRQ